MNNLAETSTSEITLKTRLPLFGFFTANTVSFVGNILTALAIPWFVLQTTGSVVQTGITAFCSTLPGILSAFFSSIVVDRLGYKRTSIAGDIASGLSVLLIPLLYHTIGLAFWQLLVLVFLGGLLKAPGSTARASLVPDLAALAKMRLERANAIDDGASRISGFIGAPLAGVLIALIGTSNLLWLDAASFFFSALVIGLVVPASPPVVQENTAGKHYWKDLLDGMRFLFHHQVLLALMATVTITNLLDSAQFSVVLPDYAQQIFKSAVPLGLLVAAFGGAAFVGTVIFGAVGHRMPRRLTFGACFLVLGLRYWAMALTSSLPVLIIVHIFAGLAAGPLNPIISTTTQELIPPEMRARVFGTSSAGYAAGIPLGAILGGFLTHWTGIVPTLLILGAGYLLATSSLLVNPALKHMQKQG